MSYTSAEGRKTIGTESSESEDSLCLDQIFGLLSNSRRRHAIEVIMEHERLPFGTLVDHVAELEYGLSIDEISSDERHTVYVSVQQSHIGKLEDAGVVEFVDGCKTGTIALGDNAEELYEWLCKNDEPRSVRKRIASVF